jgi:hypothetical protein
VVPFVPVDPVRRSGHLAAAIERVLQREAVAQRDSGSQESTRLRERASTVA